MRSISRWIPRGALLGVAAVLALAGCPAFVIDRGELVTPTHSLAMMSAANAPAADAYNELATRWRREAQIGAGGAVFGTLRDPALVAAEVAHAAALQNLGAGPLRDMLAAEWPTDFGSDGDRWPIDLEFRFDEQFIAHADVLDPNRWAFTLHVDERLEYSPIAIATLSHGQVPVQHYWEGRIRLWFPWRDHVHDLVLLAGQTRSVRLALHHPSGSADLEWRFRTAY